MSYRRALGALLLSALSAQVCFTAPAKSDEAGPEQIYVLRSVREKRTTPPTEFCAGEKSNLNKPAWEDEYTFRSVDTRDTDGRVVNDNVQPAGSIHACFGTSADANVWDFYGEFSVHSIAGKAKGKCYKTKADFPEKGINLFACVFDLYDLPPEFVGGQLTTNSVSSGKLFGTESEPAGYTQVSIATIRLWKKRGM